MPPQNVLDRPRPAAPLFRGQLPEDTNLDIEEFAARAKTTVEALLKDIQLRGLPCFRHGDVIWINTTAWREWCQGQSGPVET